jgi:hypothetical protein
VDSNSSKTKTWHVAAPVKGQNDDLTLTLTFSGPPQRRRLSRDSYHAGSTWVASGFPKNPINTGLFWLQLTL